MIYATLETVLPKSCYQHRNLLSGWHSLTYGKRYYYDKLCQATTSGGLLNGDYLPCLVWMEGAPRCSGLMESYFQVKMLIIFIVVTLIAQAVTKGSNTFDLNSVDLSTKSTFSRILAYELRFIYSTD